MDSVNLYKQIMAWKRRAKTTKSTTSVPKPKAVAKDFVFHIVTPEELLSDNTELLRFTIPGRPATKKTHQQVIYVKGSPRVIPSAQFAKYEKLCKDFCTQAWGDKGKAPMDFGVLIEMRIYLDTWSIGDHVGYMQAIGDILEKHKVIANDKFIHWGDDGIHWFGGIDKDEPRCEIVIKRFRHPYEEYRKDKEISETKKADRKKVKANGV